MRMTVASTGGKYGSSNGIRAHAGSIDTDVAASRPYGALAAIGSGGVNSRKRAASRAAGVPDNSGRNASIRSRSCVSVSGGSGTPSAACDTGGIGHVPVAAALVEGGGAVELVGEKEAVDFGDVDPFQ